jgi:hypothetical protein
MKWSKSGKSGSHCIEIFRLREKSVPVEVVDIVEANILHVAWEPKGNRDNLKNAKMPYLK